MVVGAPDLAKDLVARQGSPLRLYEADEHVELGRRHVDDVLVAIDASGVHVDLHFAEGDHAARRSRGPAPQGRANASQQLREAEGFGDVVFGAKLEPGDLVHLASARGEHDDGHRVTFAS